MQISLRSKQNIASFKSDPTVYKMELYTEGGTNCI